MLDRLATRESSRRPLTARSALTLRAAARAAGSYRGFLFPPRRSLPGTTPNDSAASASRREESLARPHLLG